MRERERHTGEREKIKRERWEWERCGSWKKEREKREREERERERGAVKNIRGRETSTLEWLCAVFPCLPPLARSEKCGQSERWSGDC